MIVTLAGNHHIIECMACCISTARSQHIILCYVKRTALTSVFYHIFLYHYSTTDETSLTL